MFENNASLLGWIAAAVVAAIFFASRKKGSGKGTQTVPEPDTPLVETGSNGSQEFVSPATPNDPDLTGDPVGSLGGFQGQPSTSNGGSDPSSPNISPSERIIEDTTVLEIEPLSPGVSEPVGDPGGFLGAPTGSPGDSVDPVTTDIDMSLSNSQFASKISNWVVGDDGSYRADLDANQDGKLNIFDASYALRGQHR